ncbi:hypothetical protein CRM22_011392 [Opisthorchis felineus]|uniref:Uncharacterized protein n=1 Tax=Opisthorchis felineus TaxID=147828 RepID=A0A4S2JLW9_OPIFE|nr:hypothetical protein CRM22_011392 [Opisthorchis felineus]
MYPTGMWVRLLAIYIGVLHPIYSAPCSKQPLSFGPNCSLVCHCLGGECDARTEGIGCFSGSCSPGYTGFPLCQQQCPQGKFGIDCSSQCNCEPENICEPTNGNCMEKNRCRRRYYGPGCQGVRTQLLNSPDISTDCVDIILSWPAFSGANYTGSSDIVRYVVLYRLSSESQLHTVRSNIKPTNATQYTYYFTPKDQDSKYVFSVRADFRVPFPPDYYTETGVPSPVTNPISAQCSSLPGFYLDVSGYTATALWKPHPNPHVRTVEVLYTPISVGDCANLSIVESNAQTHTCKASIDQLKCTVVLNPWVQYAVKSFGVTAKRGETVPLSRVITTEEDLPLGAPQNLNLLGEPSATDAILKWDPPPCTARRGSLKNWVVQIRPDTNVVLEPTDVRISSPPLHISKLLPDTSYVVRVAFRNSMGIGPFSELVFETKAQGFPKDVLVTSIKHDSCLVTWLPPDTNNGNGILSGFEVQHWPINLTVNRIASSPIPPDQTSYSISNLQAETAYSVQVFSIFGTRRVASKIVSFETLPLSVARSGITLQLIDRSSSTIRIACGVQGVSLSPGQQFVISVSRLQTLLPIVSYFRDKNISFLNSQPMIHSFSQLPAASQYQISLSTVDPNGSDKLATLIVWTKPETFAASSNLEFGEFTWEAESSHSVTVKFPTIMGYSGGPLNGFYVVVTKIPRLTGEHKIENLKGKSSAFISRDSSTQVAFYSRDMPAEPIVIGNGKPVASPGRPSVLSGYRLSNDPLESNTTYGIYAVTESYVDDVSEDVVSGFLVLHTELVTKAFSLSKRVNKVDKTVLGVSLSILLFMLAVLLLGTVTYCVCSRNGLGARGSYLTSKSPYAQTSARTNTLVDEYDRLLPKSYPWWSVPVDVREPRYLIIDPEKGPSSTLVGTWSKKELSDTFVREYASIPLGLKYPHKAGEMRANKPKNRIQSVLPYDHNRVALKRSPDSGDSDYINASFVDGYMRRRAYIASQSPFDTPTACDFWLMVFQRNVSQIVMLTNLVEDGTLKCCQYWPDIPPRTTLSRSGEQKEDSAKDCIQYFGNLIVQAVDRIAYAHFTIRHFLITDSTTGVSQRVVQYHFQSWGAPPDNKSYTGADGSSSNLPKECEQGNTNVSCFVEDDPTGTAADLFSHNTSSTSVVQFDMLAFIEFYYRVKTASRPEDGPVVVHCGTGFTRTGIYMAFDVLLQQATHEQVVSAARQCATLTKARANMFRSAQYYMLLYDMLFEALIAGHNIVNLDVLGTYRTLNHKNGKLGRSFLWEQWSVLHLFSPPPDPDMDLRVALAAPNARRNRYGQEIDLLPAERWRPHLRPHAGAPDWTDYINAVFLDGTNLRDDLILTQTPLATTVDDFWSLVDEEKISCIVDMEPFGYGTKGAVRYWPLRAGEINSEPLFEGSSDEDRIRPDTQSDADDAAATRSPWCPMVHGYLQVCQVGSLTPVILDHSGRKVSSSHHGIYRRRLLVRCVEHRTKSNYLDFHERCRRREVLIFHFAGDWNTTTQVPESRAAIVRLLEAIRLERGTGPLLIHCLDGATRSGLLAVCHLLAERMTRDHYVDLFHVIKSVKIRRRAVLASQDQLRYVYRLLAQWVKQTLSEPLAAWTAKHLGDMGDIPEKCEWPQLLGHLPSYVRAGIYSTSQLPALVADHSTLTLRSEEGVTTANVNNSVTDGGPNENVACSLYHYFHDELLNQRCTRSLHWSCDTRQTADLSEVNSWSMGSLNKLRA